VELIERYIYAVIKSLPEKERAEVEKELRANIEDMLRGRYDDASIKKVLEELGDPDALADEYRGEKRYLIGPKYYSLYITVLKLVVRIVASVLGSISLISAVLEQPAQGDLIGYFVHALVGVIGAAFSGALTAAVWVTAVFAIVEKTNAQIKPEAWSPDKLPQLPNNSTKIKSGEVILSLVFYVLWIGVLLSSPSVIGIYESGYGMTPLFDIQTLQKFYPLILTVSGVGILLCIVKLIYGRWNIKIALLNLVMNLFNTFTLLIIIRNESIINPAFVSRFQNIMNLSPSVFDKISAVFIGFIVVAAIIGTVADSIGGFVKAYKTIN